MKISLKYVVDIKRVALNDDTNEYLWLLDIFKIVLSTEYRVNCSSINTTRYKDTK